MDRIVITRFTARPVIVPLNIPLQTSSGTVGTAPLVLVDCETDHGARGHSYAFAITTTALKALTELVRAMSDLIAGDGGPVRYRAKADCTLCPARNCRSAAHRSVGHRHGRLGRPRAHPQSAAGAPARRHAEADTGVQLERIGHHAAGGCRRRGAQAARRRL